VGDLNNDGRDDIARFERRGLSRVVARASRAVRSSLGYENPTSTTFAPEVVARSSDPLCQTDGTFCSFGRVVPSGGEDLVEIDGATGNLRMLAASTPGGVVTLSPAPGFTLAAACPAATCRPAMGDVNGDGRDDLVLFPISGSNVRWARNTGSGWAVGASLTTSSLCARTNTPCRVADVDGDGQADIVAFLSSGETRVRRRLLSTVTESVWHTETICSDGAQFASCEVADANGDGVADVISVGNGGTAAAPTGGVVVAISLATRSSFFIDPRTGAP